MNLKELRQYIKDHGLKTKGRSKADILNKLKPELEARKNLKPLGQYASEVPKPAVQLPAPVQAAPELPPNSADDAADIYETLYAHQLCMFGRFKYMTFEQVVQRFPELSKRMCNTDPRAISPFMMDRVVMFQKYARRALTR